MTNIRVAFSSVLLMTAFAFSTTALAQNAPAPTTATGSPTNKPSAAPAAPAGSPTRPVVAPGGPPGAPITKPAANSPPSGAGNVPFGTAPRPAPVVTNPAGTPPPSKGNMAPTAPMGATGASGSAAAAPGAAPAAAPPMPAPNKDMMAFWKGFEGTWRCDTKFMANAMGPGSPEILTKSTAKIRKDYGGISWHGEYSLPKTKMMPAMSGVFQIAHEPGSNGATIVGYDSMGSAFMGTGAISGESATFTEDGYMMGTKAKVRETFIKKGPREVGHTYEVDMGKGFQLVGEDACKR